MTPNGLLRLVFIVLCVVVLPNVCTGQVHPEGLFVGVEQLGDEAPKPDESGLVWYHENVLTIRGDSLFLQKSLVCYSDGRKYNVAASPTTVSSYAGRIGDGSTVFLKIIYCETCGVELQQNPDTGVYEEIANRGTTVSIRFDGDVVHLDGVAYMKKG